MRYHSRRTHDPPERSPIGRSRAQFFCFTYGNFGHASFPSQYVRPILITWQPILGQAFGPQVSATIGDFDEVDGAAEAP